MQALQKRARYVNRESREPGWKAMHRAADRNVRLFRKAFLDAVSRIRAIVRQTSAENLVADRIPWPLFERKLEEGVLPAVKETVAAGARAARLDLARAIGRRVVLKQVATELTIDLQVRNANAEMWASAEAADMVREVSMETRLAIRAIVLEAQQNGLSIPQQARLIRRLVGLTRYQYRAVINFAERLRKRGYSESAIDMMTRNYYNRLVRQRAKLIARTETIRAANAGQQALWNQAVSEGYLETGRMKVWIVTPDDRLCPLCEAVGGQRVPVGQMFDTPIGPVMSPDLHPGCRCAMSLEEVGA